VKLAVLSDIHGNLPALEAVLEDIVVWGAELVVMNGDLVSRGPYSLASLELLEATLPGVTLIAGNHEEYVVEASSREYPAGSVASQLNLFARWSADQLGSQVLERFKQLPDHLDLLDLDGGTLHVTHGSRMGNRAGISASTSDEQLVDRIGDPRDLFIASHTHRPLLRTFGETQIVNVGSVGTPMDGDPRASYGRMLFHHGCWRVEIRRVAYDRAQTERDFHQSGFVDASGSFGEIILNEFREARILAGSWMRLYHPLVVAGELSVAEAVSRHLDEQAVARKPVTGS
jgi:predicted phosphodiesterase